MSLAAIRAKNGDVVLAGKRAVVVGGTSGIGHGIAMRLARAKASVTIVGRSEERGKAAVQEMVGLSGEGCQHEFVAVDSFELKRVVAFANEYRERHPSLDYLVMSQGMATLQGFTPTSEGLDQKLTLHYWSRMAYATALLPIMTGEDARVVSILSAGVHSAYQGYEKDPELKDGGYSLKNAADSAGFYNDLGLDSLSREHPAVGFSHVAPGFVHTRWGTEMPWLVRGMVRVMQYAGRSEEDCGEYMCEAIFSPSFAKGFHLLDQYGQATAAPTSLHEKARVFVWEHTKTLLARVAGL